MSRALKILNEESPGFKKACQEYQAAYDALKRCLHAMEAVPLKDEDHSFISYFVKCDKGLTECLRAMQPYSDMLSSLNVSYHHKHKDD